MSGLFRLATLPIAALLGYWAVGMVAPSEPAHEEPRRGPTPPPMVGLGSPWSRALVHTRQVAPSRAEEAWVEWADNVSTNEIPAAAAALDGTCEFVALQVLFARWALSDPQGALRAWRDKNIAATLSVPMDMQPGKIGRSTLNSKPRCHVGGALLKAWASHQPKEAAQFASEALSRKDADFHSWDLEAAVAPVSGPRREFGRFNETVKSNPKQAAEEALKLPSSERQASAGRAVLAEWVKSDPVAAEAWYRSWPEATKSALATANFDYPMAAAPADMRARLWLERVSPELSDESLRQASTSFGRYDRGSAASHTATALVEWMSEDFSAARAWVQSQTRPQIESFLTGHLAGALVGQGRSTDAVALVDALPDENKPLALHGLVQGWTAVDAKAAASWAETIEDSDCRDASLSTIVTSVSLENPSWALGVAAKISDGTKRDIATTSVINSVKWSPVSNAQLLGEQGFPIE
jgi:hypothetical protein